MFGRQKVVNAYHYNPIGGPGNIIQIPACAGTRGEVPLREQPFHYRGGAGRVFEKIIWRCFWPKKNNLAQPVRWKNFFALICCKKNNLASTLKIKEPQPQHWRCDIMRTRDVNIFDLKHDYKKIIWLSILCEKKIWLQLVCEKTNPTLNIRWKNNLLKTTLPAPPPPR